jgi:CBS domain containing-hemolysin-like protein
MAGQVFLLKEIRVTQIMLPIQQFPQIKDSCTVHGAHKMLQDTRSSVAIVINNSYQIVGYIQAQNLSFEPKFSQSPIKYSSPSFIGTNTSCLDTFFAMRKENTHVAFVIGPGGEIIGITTLDTIISRLVSKTESNPTHIEKTVSAETFVDTFFRRYNLLMPSIPNETFGELVERLLGHKPTIHDIAHIGSCELIVTEATIRGAKTIVVKTTT